MRKIALGFVLALAFFSLQHSVFALEGIIQAPSTEGSATCGSVYQSHKTRMGSVNAMEEGEAKTDAAKVVSEFLNTELKTVDLGRKIKGGCVQLSDIPLIVIHLIDLCTKLAGTIAVIFLLYAGFQMIISGVSDDREAAKNTIKYAITGLIVSFLAWVIVNLVQVQLTI